MQLFIVIASFVSRRTFLSGERYGFSCNIKRKGTKYLGAEGAASLVPSPPWVSLWKGFWKVSDLSFEVRGRRKANLNEGCHWSSGTPSDTRSPNSSRKTEGADVTSESHVLEEPGCPPQIAYPWDLRGSCHWTWLQGPTGLWCLEESCIFAAQAVQRRCHARKKCVYTTWNYSKKIHINRTPSQNPIRFFKIHSKKLFIYVKAVCTCTLKMLLM